MKIIGIVLVKNEDIYIENAIENVIDFCDSIIVLDNKSSDSTYSILIHLAKKYPSKIILHSIDNALLSHGYIQEYANTDTWIFAVDGDEIYDKNRLIDFRKTILAGEYNSYWKIFGNCIHVDKVDLAHKSVIGYMTPPSRSITKLYNFNAITKWEEYTERLHGTKIEFKPNYENKIFHLHDSYTWDESPFRCAHMCFVQRSSLDRMQKKPRFNPLENSKPFFKIINLIRNITHGNLSFQSSYKLQKYRQGPLSKVSSDGFLFSYDRPNLSKLNT